MRDDDNLIITGFMGTGKTSVGMELAQRLEREFVDMDALIEAREGMAISEIFAQHGEPYFRQLEASLCRELAARTELVVATGGGALIPTANREILCASGLAVCLGASPGDIVQRLDASRDRPLLNVMDQQSRIATLLSERSAAYSQIPFRVDTTAVTVGEVADRIMALSNTPQPRVIPVSYPGGKHSICLGHGLLAQSGDLLIENDLTGTAALVTSPTVGHYYTKLTRASLETAGYDVATCVVPDGEKHKTLDTVRTIYDQFIEAGLDRHSMVLAMGGGVIGDMAGFAAATYLRGVSLVQVPTSLLAIVDASIGGKLAVDHPRGKNLIGAFKHPQLVIADYDTLSTLPMAELTNGLAEVVKAGLISAPELFEQIEAHGPSPLPWIIEQAIRVKVSVIQQDPYEHGRRAVLNLGHTFGHALERLSGYALSHGAGVSIGLAAAARLSKQLGLCSQGLADRVEGVLSSLGLPTKYQGFGPLEVWQAMDTDKKRRGKKLRFVLLRAVGDVLVTDQVTQKDVLSVLETLEGS